MRRPLVWIAVSLALLPLFSSHRVVESDPVPAAAVPSKNLEAAQITGVYSPSPFAYVREDGSEVYLPPRGSTEGRRAVQFEDAAVAIPDPAAAVYPWSSPMSDSLGERAFF